MIKNISKLMSDYNIAFNQINEVYKDTKAYCDKTFVPTSSMYKSTLETAKKTRQTALEPIMNKQRDEIKKTVNSSREAIQRAIMREPSESELKTIELLKSGVFSDTEKAMMLDSLKGNYIASKIAHNQLGIEFTNTVEGLYNHLNTIEEIVNKHWSEEYVPSNSYNSRLLIQGDFLGSVSDSIDTFLSTYSGGDK